MPRNSAQKLVCAGREMQGKLDKMRLHSLEKMSRKAGKCVWGGLDFVGTFEI